jgi:twitching motility protein PilI
MAAVSPINQLREIEQKSLARKALAVQAAQTVSDWRGIGFRIGNVDLVASMSNVAEVLNPVHYTRVPSSKVWFEGIANVRGQLVPVTDLYSFIHNQRRPSDRDTRIMMFRLANSVSGLVVTAVTGIRNFREDNRSLTVSTDVDEKLRPYIGGTFQHGGDEYPIFDFSRLLNDEKFMHITETHG